MDQIAPLNSNIQINQETIPGFMTGVTSQFIVRPANGQPTIGISGFVFDVIGNEEMMLDSEITDHFTEDNISIQDQIALRPEQFTLSGYVGEVVSTLPGVLVSILTSLSSLKVVSDLVPGFSKQADQFYGEIAHVAIVTSNVINEAENIFSLFSDISTTANKQQKAFQYFYNLWLSRQFCQVETPYGILENMAILSVRAKQDETTRIISDISVTFKALRFVKTSTTTSTGIDLSTTSERATQIATETPVSGGTTSGKAENSSILSRAIDQLNS